MIAAALTITVSAQHYESKLTVPPSTPNPNQLEKQSKSDSLDMQYKVRPTYPVNYNDYLTQGEYPADLTTPSNITTEAQYDPELGCYIVRTKVGDMEIATPFMLSVDEYNNMALKESLRKYYQQKNSLEKQEKKSPFNFLDMQFGLGPLEKIFGPGGVQLKTQGSITVNMGVKSNKTDNPALPVESRRHTYFDFDKKIQAIQHDLQH